MPPARLAVLVLAPALLAGCAAETAPEEERLGPWVRIDLWARPPAVEMQTAPADPAAPPYAAEVGWLGAAEVRDLSRLSARELASMPQRPAARVRALSQDAGSRLAWSLSVPAAEPYLALTPLGSPEGDCPCLFRAGVRDADGAIHELYRTPAGPVPWLAPAAAELDLSPYAGTRIEVLLQVDLVPGADPARRAAAGRPPRVQWASPAVYGRLAPGEDPAAWDEPPGAEPAGAANRGPNSGPRGGPRGGGERPVNVLLLGLDTLRYDAVGPGRHDPSLTPNLDALAAESDVWERAFSTFNNTNPSFASILSGLYGKNHGVYDLRTPLPEAHATLAEQLAAAGWEGFAAISARHLGPRWSGLGRGFSEVVTSDHLDAGELVADRALEWLAGREAPWFAWLHFFDVHTPHTPPQPYGLGFRPAAAPGLSPVASWLAFRQPGPLEYVEHVLAGRPELYYGEVAYLDRQLGRVLAFLDSRGVLDDTVVAVVADHGESLGEHGVQCSHSGLHDTTTHVPLMIRWPDRLLEGPAWMKRRGRRFSGLVQTLDLFPTLLAAAGLEAPPSDGVDLRKLTPEPDGPEPAGDPPGRRYVFAEHANRLGVMVRTQGWKYIVHAGHPQFPDGPALYDLAADPGETANLAGRGLAAETELAAVLARWQAALRPAHEARPEALAEEDRQQLRSLGYLQ